MPAQPSRFRPSYRKKAQSWYSSRRWKNLRAEQLSTQPLCAMCRAEGRATPAKVADHVVPHRGDEHLFWNGKLQSLCKPHHDRDKALIEGGKAIKTYGNDGWPID